MATIQGTAGNDSLTGTQGDDSISGLAGSDTINALGGNDTLDGGAGIDTLNGGLGNDRYIVTAGDVLSDTGGTDTVVTDVNWSLGADFENIQLAGTGNISATGNNLANLAIGNSGNNYFNMRAGDDTIQAGAGNDWIDMSAFGTASYGNDFIHGGDGIDTVNFAISAGQQSAITVDLNAQTIRGGGQGGAGSAIVTSVETVIGTAFNDSMKGSSPFAETFEGREGNDTLAGMGGNDTLTGGAGQDLFAFSAAPGAGNVDQILDFASATDKLGFDISVFGELGAPGNFAAGDARFAAGAGFTSGRDASDRIIYNTSTGQLFYDADGNGAGASQLIATLQGAPALAATDIVVTGVDGHAVIQGTEGNDSLAGTEGRDVINGLGGDDTLDGGLGTDTMDGGLGNDTYFVDGDFFDTNDRLSDPGGIDLVVSSVDWFLGSGFFGFENLTLTGSNSVQGQGNDLPNVMRSEAFRVEFIGWEGNDTLFGGGVGDGSRVGAGNDLLEGGEGDDEIHGGGGMDLITDGSGNDRIFGDDGNDSIQDQQGDDSLFGGAGDDVFMVFASDSGVQADQDVIDGGAGVDTVQIEAPGSGVVINLANGTMRGGGPGGSDSATLVSIENAFGTPFADRITGDSGANELRGTVPGLSGIDAGDTLDGAGGIDTLTGGEGATSFVFSAAPGTANADQITDFASGTDEIRLDGRVMTELGASGDFVAGDARFFAAAGATGGHDADDRVIYNTSTGQLFYDADGNGVGGAQLIATLESGATLAATDVAVDNATVSGGQTITGTDGNDSLTGTEGNDSISGLGGSDTINGLGGNDTLAGGAAVDVLSGGDGNDSVLGGDGNDGVSGDAGDDTLDGGSGNDFLEGADGNDSLVGGDGNDHLVGSFDNPNVGGLNAFDDTLDGGLGDDLFGVRGGETLIDAGGIDTVLTKVSWTLGAGFENIIVQGVGLEIHGNELGNVIGQSVPIFDDHGAAPSTRIFGGAGNDTIDAGGIVDGEAGDDVLSTAGATVTGGTGADRFLAGGGQITDFTSNSDKIVLDADAGFRDVGASGTFAPGDGRFFAAAGATAGHDADDRIIYNTARGELFYDPDGNGAQSAQLIETLHFAPTLVATDIEVVGGTAPGQTISGTAGDDSLNGTEGADSISGLAGADRLNGLGGNDTLDGGAGIDTMVGGPGDDVFIVTAGDVLFGDPSDGIDTVVTDVSWTLDGFFENLTMTGTGNISGTGHNGANLAIGNSGNNYFNMRGGDDTIQAGAGNDWIDMSAFGSGSWGNDVIDGGAGTDTVNFAISAGQQGGIVADLTAGTIRGGSLGSFGGGSVTSIERVIGAGFNDSIKGAAAAETLEGREGSDTLSGMGGNDTLVGGTGSDSFVFAASPGAGNVDLVSDFVSGTDKAAFDNAVFTALGADGNFAAGDARFAAGAGFTSGHDASDRIVYNTTTGQLFYDADGSGAGAAQLIATFQGAPAIAATDITVI